MSWDFLDDAILNEGVVIDDNWLSIDEIKRNAFLAEICAKYSVSSDKIDIYDKAISTYKNELATYNNFNCENKLFYPQA